MRSMARSRMALTEISFACRPGRCRKMTGSAARRSLVGGTARACRLGTWTPATCAHRPVTAAPVSIDPYVVASRHETVFEGSQVKGARRRRCRDAQGGGREDLLCVDAHHKALDKEASRDRGRGARADPRQALQERSDA